MKSIVTGLYCLSIALLLSGCSMEKRLYQKGYHIDWLSQQNREKRTSGFQTEVEQTKQENTPLRLRGIAAESITDHPTTNPTVTTTFASISKREQQQLAHPVSFANYSGLSTQNVDEVVYTSADVRPKNGKLSKQLFQKRNDDRLVLLIILALLLPPLAVYLFERNRWTSRCTLNLVLTLLCGIPGVIHALIVILGNR